MRTEPYELPARTTRLSPLQAARLEAAVDSLREQVGTSRDFLELLCEKLADAAYLASWLRDYVCIEFTREEVVDLLQALANLHNGQLLSDESHSALCELCGQLERGSVELECRQISRGASKEAKEISIG
jgi:hypothetical protein